MALQRESTLTREERAKAHLVADRAATRDAWRSTLLGAVVCLVWMALGLYGLGWSLHVTDERTGNLIFWGSLVIANSGIVATIYWVVRKAEHRGDMGS